MAFNSRALAIASFSVIVSALITVLSAQLYETNPEEFQLSSSRVKRNFFGCLCSPSGRGYLQSQLTLLSRGLSRTRVLASKLESEGMSGSELLKAIENELKKYLGYCVRKYGYEACVNADAAMRRSRYQYCAYDSQTGKNLALKPGSRSMLLSLKPCSMSERLASTDKARGSPTGTKGTASPGSPSQGSGTVAKPEPSPTSEKEGNSGTDATKATAVPIPQRSPTGTPAAKSTISPDPVVPSKPVMSSANEGCVAMEHLKGYTLQHRQHLMRPVLCGRGFCATANHAIIVRGETTSMKQLCSSGGWQCSQEVKLVNNLKIAANRRAFAGDVTITPYDIRFPVLIIWIVQIAEDVLELCLGAVIIGLFTAFSLLLLRRDGALNTSRKKVRTLTKSRRSLNLKELCRQFDECHVTTRCSRNVYVTS